MHNQSRNSGEKYIPDGLNGFTVMNKPIMVVQLICTFVDVELRIDDIKIEDSYMLMMNGTDSI